jgi:hypothetical protein
LRILVKKSPIVSIFTSPTRFRNTREKTFSSIIAET